MHNPHRHHIRRRKNSSGRCYVLRGCEQDGFALSAAISNTRVPSLQRPTPRSDVTFLNCFSKVTAPASLSGEYMRVFIREKHFGWAERGILVLEYRYYDFQNPQKMASWQLCIERIIAAGTSFSPISCHALDGYIATCAHRLEVKVGSDGHASAPPPGPPPLRRRRVPRPRLCPRTSKSDVIRTPPVAV
jgi:hypothetical protein